MDPDPIRDQRLLAALESCRPGSDDLADPEMAELAAELAADARLAELQQRIERTDARLAAAFHDVPVPEGLQQRLLEHLAAARPQPAPSPPRRVSRRWLIASVGSLAAAAALLIAAWVQFQPARPLDEADVLNAALALFNEELPGPGSVAPPPKDLPFSRDLARRGVVRWRPIDGFLGHRGAAYDIRLPGGNRRATLYVVKLTVGGLPGQPPPRPTHTTLGYSTAAWQENGRLYVLVVDGNAGTYRGLLDLPHGPVT